MPSFPVDIQNPTTWDYGSFCIGIECTGRGLGWERRGGPLTWKRVDAGILEFTNSKIYYPKYPDTSKLAILRTLPLLCRFKSFHWRVQWSIGTENPCFERYLLDPETQIIIDVLWSVNLFDWLMWQQRRGEHFALHENPWSSTSHTWKDLNSHTCTFTYIYINTYMFPPKTFVLTLRWGRQTQQKHVRAILSVETNPVMVRHRQELYLWRDGW